MTISKLQLINWFFSSCSEFFKNIFKNNNHSHLLICLDGITSAELENILNYMYDGEVNIFQDDLDRFLAVAQRFKLEGLLGDPNQHQEEEPCLAEESIQTHALAKNTYELSRKLKVQSSNDQLRKTLPPVGGGLSHAGAG